MFHALHRWLRRRRARALSREIPAEAWQQVEACLPVLGHLSLTDRQRLRQLSLEFLVSKQMSAAQGLTLRLPIQLSIALQACLPILNLGLDWYDGWQGIVVYPGDFVIPRQETDECGIVHEFDDTVLGEAWHGGPVLLSWFDDEENHAPERAGCQIVLHEFAHQLDMKNGAADGFPPLHSNMSRTDWHAAFATAYADFRQRIETGGEDHSQLDPYGASAPAEFFAVMSEAFFSQPAVLLEEYPAVHEQLRHFYRQNPGKSGQ